MRAYSTYLRADIPPALSRDRYGLVLPGLSIGREDGERELCPAEIDAEDRHARCKGIGELELDEWAGRAKVCADTQMRKAHRTD